MSDTLQETNTDRANPLSTEVHSDLSGYDGSRTPPDVQFEILRLHKRHGHSPHAIGQILSMDPRTVKAVIARENQEGEDARNYLNAHRLWIAQKMIVAVDEAAKRGKLEGISGLSDRLAITEPPKAQNQAQVAVQINLNGGPEPQALVVDALPDKAPTETGLK